MNQPAPDALQGSDLETLRQRGVQLLWPCTQVMVEFASSGNFALAIPAIHALGLDSVEGLLRPQMLCQSLQEQRAARSTMYTEERPVGPIRLDRNQCPVGAVASGNQLSC